MSLILFIASAAPLRADEKPKFRTDAEGPVKAGEKREKGAPDWYQVQPGEFPPEGSAHAVSGELLYVDKLERRFAIRVDRNDSQDRGVWDLPVWVTMLPYGSIHYLGAPAAIEDIPLGTHLQGLFYTKDPNDKTPPPPEPYFSKRSPEVNFQRGFRIEDDYSYHARQKQIWKVESVNLDTKKLNAVLLVDGKPEGAPKAFDLLAGTRVYKDKALAELKAIEPGQTVLFNLTWVTLYGPGRITDIWLDEPSRAAFTGNQLERHRTYIRERGLPGFVTAVEDEPQLVTVRLFGGVDEMLLTEWQRKDVGSGSLAVARESLMTYDPVNDRKSGSIVEVKKIPVEPGSSGVQIKLKMDLMLEGYRPKRVVRFYPSPWKVNSLPKEQEFFSRE